MASRLDAERKRDTVSQELTSLTDSHKFVDDQLEKERQSHRDTRETVSALETSLTAEQQKCLAPRVSIDEKQFELTHQLVAAEASISNASKALLLEQNEHAQTKDKLKNVHKKPTSEKEALVNGGNRRATEVTANQKLQTTNTALAEAAKKVAYLRTLGMNITAASKTFKGQLPSKLAS